MKKFLKTMGVILLIIVLTAVLVFSINMIWGGYYTKESDRSRSKVIKLN